MTATGFDTSFIEPTQVRGTQNTPAEATDVPAVDPSIADVPDTQAAAVVQASTGSAARKLRRRRTHLSEEPNGLNGRGFVIDLAL